MTVADNGAPGAPCSASPAEAGQGPARSAGTGSLSNKSLLAQSFSARRLPALQSDSVTSAFPYGGAGWSCRSARRGQRVGELKGGGRRETLSSLLPGKQKQMLSGHLSSHTFESAPKKRFP